MKESDKSLIQFLEISSKNKVKKPGKDQKSLKTISGFIFQPEVENTLRTLVAYVSEHSYAMIARLWNPYSLYDIGYII